MERPRDERGRFVSQRRAVPDLSPHVWTRSLYAAPAPAPRARRRMPQLSPLAWLYAAEGVAVVGLVAAVIYGAAQ